MNTRQIIFLSLALVAICALAVWWYLGLSFDFMRFFAANPASLDTTIASPSPMAQESAGGIVSCSPDTQPIKVGVPAQLLGHGGDTAYEWFAPGGSPRTATGKSFSVTYDEAGIKKVTIQSKRGDGTGNVDSVQCTVEVIP